MSRIMAIIPAVVFALNLSAYSAEAKWKGAIANAWEKNVKKHPVTAAVVGAAAICVTAVPGCQVLVTVPPP